MNNWNKHIGLMLRTLIGTAFLAYAGLTVAAERISLDSLQTQIRALQTENAAQASLLQSQAAAISALNAALTQEVSNRMTYADNIGSSTLASAKTYADTQLTAAKTYSDGKLAPVADKLTHFSRSGNNVYITGANLNIRNGMGSTYGSGVNGLGNLIVGYNESRGLTTDPDVRTGSHNLILGQGMNFSAVGAILNGINNGSTGHFASVLGGTGNVASGTYSVVVGGYNNKTTGGWSTILGGRDRTAATQLDHLY